MALQLVAFVLAAFTMVPGFSLIHSASSRGALRAARAGGMPYWYGYTPITAFQYPLNFTSGRLTHQNFGGQGPDAGDESLVFSNVGKVNGASFDMRLAASSGQTWQGNLSKTSLDNDAVIASFNMMSGTSTEVNVHFLDSVTKDPVIVPRFFLTVLDVDAGSLEDFGRNPRTSGGIESYRISHVKMFWVSSSHDINIQRVAHEEYNFTATEVGGVADNPTQALDLTEEQQNRAVMLEIRDRSWFHFAFAASPGTSNRNVMFSGPSQLGSGVPSVCMRAAILDLSDATVALNNLHGKTDTAPREMHIKNAMQWSGDSIDLTVRVLAGNYEAHDGSKNGLHGSFGNINLQANSGKVVFEFSFTKDEQPFAVADLLFTFGDIDQDEAEESFEEVSIASGTGAYFLSWNSTIVDTVGGDGFVTFASSIPGAATNNPEGEYLAAGQRDKAVTLAFEEPVQSFTASLSAQSKWPGGRNIAFGGDASLVCR